MRRPAAPLLLAVLAVLAAATLAPAGPARSDTLLRTDFNADAAWPEATGTGGATLARRAVGTVDVVNTSDASGALLLSSGGGSGALASGLLPVRSAEKDAAKLTLAFSLSASSTRPVTVRVASFDAAKRRTGGLVGAVHPAAPDFFQRYALDLGTLKADGGGRFDPAAPFVQFTFAPEGADTGAYEMRLDNVHYATPAYYVNPNAGGDARDGRSEKTAFATVQKALDVAGPGDIVVLMNGTHRAEQRPVAAFKTPGRPDAWISLKNYPGHRPVLTSTGWNIVSIADGSKERPSEIPALAYLEVRGLHVRGEGDVARKRYPEAIGKGDPRTNSNGIAADGRYMKNYPHHLRFADNLVEYCPGQGLGALEADWVTIENNVSRFNCWTTIYATSGISVMGASNFDTLDNVYKVLVRNNTCYRNETHEKWQQVNRISDGNGIILDVNQKTASRPNDAYRGRTLVQSNLCFDNGGSGIHTVTANRVDILHNTAYRNSASKSLEYSQIYAYGSEDVRILNNILVAPVADVAAGEKPEPVNRLGGRNANVVFAHNVYFGGNIPATLGEGDVVADPRFVRPSLDGEVADFRLRPDSPARGAAKWYPFSPTLDRDGKPRKHPLAAGAYAN